LLAARQAGAGVLDAVTEFMYILVSNLN